MDVQMYIDEEEELDSNETFYTEGVSNGGTSMFRNPRHSAQVTPEDSE